MYGIVLMAALTTGANAPDCHRVISHGCAGSYGCAGCYGSYSCAGCYGSYSSYSCAGCYGCNGCHGSFLATRSYGCHGCYGCYGGYGCTGCYGGVILPTAPVMPGAKEQAPLPNPVEKGKKDEEVRAKLIVEVPTDAVLYIDGVKMKTTAERRVFTTPALVPGQSFFYDLKAEIVRDGQTLSETTRVIVRAGEEARATFATLANPPVTPAAVAGR